VVNAVAGSLRPIRQKAVEQRRFYDHSCMPLPGVMRQRDLFHLVKYRPTGAPSVLINADLL
jgi:hypothetical protein